MVRHGEDIATSNHIALPIFNEQFKKNILKSDKLQSFVNEEMPRSYLCLEVKV